jgi:hypothetical protein
MISSNILRYLFMACTLLFVFSGLAQEKNKNLKANLDAYRNNVYKQIESGNGAEVEVKLGYVTYRPEGNAYLGATYKESTDHYLTLNEIEGIFLIQHNFEGILDIVRNNAFVFYKRGRVELIDPRESTKAGIIPRRNNSGLDSLNQHIGTFVLNNTANIKSGILASNHSEEVKDFLNVFVDYEAVYLWDVWKILRTRDEINADWENYHLLDSLAQNQAELFVAKYPESEFNEFINEFILYENIVNNWGWGLDFNLGSVIPTGEISEYVKPAYFYVDLGFRIYYKNAFLNVMGGITSSGLRNNIFHDTIWSKGLTMLTGDLTLGYCFDITKRFNISPLVGLRGIVNLGPDFNGKESRFSVRNPFTFGMEFSIGGMSGGQKYISPYYSNGKNRDGISLRLMYQNPSYEQTIPELKGGLLTATLGLNIAFFKVKDPNKNLYK